MREPHFKVQLLDQDAGNAELGSGNAGAFCIKVESEQLISWPVILNNESGLNLTLLSQYSQAARNARRIRRWNSAAQAKKIGVKAISQTLLRVNEVYVPILNRCKSLKSTLEEIASKHITISISDMLPLYLVKRDTNYCVSIDTDFHIEKHRFFLYQNMIWSASVDEAMETWQAQVDNFLASKEAPKRGPLSSEVRVYVWRRDEGKCVRCGSRDKLEFDHIIPVTKGGSDTARNIELLCQHCNRRKSSHVQ